MPQEFQVLQCYQCSTFQVHQMKKSTKWMCKLCGEKQSSKKVFGRGSAVDCRHHVQKLNSLRANIDHVESQKHQAEDVEHGTTSSLIEASQIQHLQWSSDAPGRWSRFIEENTSEDFGEMSNRDIQFVTDRRDLKQTKTKQRRNLKRKRDMSFNSERNSLLESKNFGNTTCSEEAQSPNIQNSTAGDSHTGGQGQRHYANKHIMLPKTDVYAAYKQDQGFFGFTENSYSGDKDEGSIPIFEDYGKGQGHGIVTDIEFTKNSSSKKISKWGRYAEAAESGIASDDDDDDDDDTNGNNQYLLLSKGDNSESMSSEHPKCYLNLKNTTHAAEINTENYIHDGVAVNRRISSSLRKNKNEFQITGMSKWGQFCDSPESVTGSSQDITDKTEKFKDEQETVSANVLQYPLNRVRKSNDSRTSRGSECNQGDERTSFQGHDSPICHVRPHSSKNGDNSQSTSNGEVTKILKNTKPLFVIGDITDDDLLI